MAKGLYRAELALRRAMPEAIKIWGRAARLMLTPSPPAAPQIPQDLLAEARLLSDRVMFLEAVPKGGTVCELGTLYGDFAREILARTQPQQLDLVDVDFGACAAEVLAHPAVTAHTVLTTDYLAGIEDGRYDLIYVDADHSYEAVKADIAAARNKVKPGGLLAFNDFARMVRPGLGEFGVHQAVCQFMVAERWPMVFFCFNGEALYDVVLRRPLGP